MDGLKYLNLNIIKKELVAQPLLTIEVHESEFESTITQIKARMLNRSVSDISEDTEVKNLTFREKL